MTPLEVAAAFRRGEIVGPRGPLPAKACVLTTRALLMFTGDAVLKLRRPVVLHDGDQRTTTQRLGATALERWIGRRASPNVYLDDAGLVPERGGGARLVARPARVGVEPLVAMRRLPTGLRADLWIAEHPATVDDFAPAMQAVARFHERSPVHRRHVGWGAPGRAGGRWEAALADLIAVADDALAGPDERQALADAAAADLDAIGATLDHRVKEGRLRHVHGDLRLAHVFLTDEPAFIDPADGDEARHWTDTAEDVALLAVELTGIGRPELAAGALEVYRRAARDRTLPRVLPFFQRLVAVRRAAATRHEAARAPSEAVEGLYTLARQYVEAALRVAPTATG